MPPHSVCFGVGILWNALCQDNENACISEIHCTMSLNVEIVSTIPTMEIKVPGIWKVCFFTGFFAEISEET
jgi:hypothetical protein